jgi:hypothetical protein
MRGVATASIVLLVSVSTGVIAQDTLRLCVKHRGQVRVIGPGETCGPGESLVESAGALRFVDAGGRTIGPWVDVNHVGFPIADPVGGDFWVLARAGRNFYTNLGEIDYDAPDCERGGGAPYLLADPNAIMRNGIVIEGHLGFTTPTLVYPANPIQRVAIQSRLLMSFGGTIVCNNIAAGVPMLVGPLASIGVAFRTPFNLVR